MQDDLDPRAIAQEYRRQRGSAEAMILNSGDVHVSFWEDDPGKSYWDGHIATLPREKQLEVRRALLEFPPA